jgi:subtilisin family serine protease
VPRDAIEIGMIDAGVEEDHPALRDADITIKTTAQSRGKAKPTAHGTAVASLLVGEDRDFHGALPGAKLYAADAFGGAPTGGSAGDIARAIAWLVDENVPVINISITGPKNALLEAAVRAALERGHVIVAAVGNDGPAAPVKYPAAYNGVIAVTAVDERGRVQLDANRGPAVTFAAAGVNVRAAQLADEYATITGTSFASPIVAARFAELMPEAGAEHVAAARDALIAATKRASEEKRSIVYGYGILRTSQTTSDLTAAQ